jgi:transcriptional regulator with XRE-family HTH domain
MQKREVKPGRPLGATSSRPDVAKAFGEVVQELRKARGVSQEDLAFLTQIERSHMGKIERGQHSPSLAMVLAIAEVLKVKPGKILDLAVTRLPPKPDTP